MVNIVIVMNLETKFLFFNLNLGITTVNHITFINNVFDDYMNVWYILAFDFFKGFPKSSKQIIRSSPSELTTEQKRACET